MAGHGWGTAWVLVAAATLLHAGGLAQGDCWLIEGDKGFVWLAICSQNQPPYEAIPQQINNTIVDLRLNENRIRSVQYASLSRFGNLTYLNLTKNEIQCNPHQNANTSSQKKQSENSLRKKKDL